MSSKQFSRTAIVIAGMARSGTSALAGTLGLCGCSLPKDILKASIHNPKGYFESVGMINLYEELMASLHSSFVDWDTVPAARQLSPAARPYLDRARTIFKEIYPAGDSLIVMKDPRYCRFLPFTENMLDELGIDMRIVIPFRNPIEVAHSQIEHYDISMAQGYLIWLRRVLDGEYFTRSRKRVFVYYPELLVTPQAILDKIKAGLQIEFPLQEEDYANDVAEFLDTGLRRRHSDTNDPGENAALTSWVMPVFEALLVLNDDPYNTQAMNTLTRIKREFDAACDLFSPVIKAHINTHASHTMLLREMDKIYKSTSWRITRSLRTLRYWLYYMALSFAEAIARNERTRTMRRRQRQTLILKKP